MEKSYKHFEIEYYSSKLKKSGLIHKICYFDNSNYYYYMSKNIVVIIEVCIHESWCKIPKVMWSKPEYV